MSEIDTGSVRGMLDGHDVDGAWQAVASSSMVRVAILPSPLARARTATNQPSRLSLSLSLSLNQTSVYHSLAHR